VNTIYRIVWNAATGKWNVASELATSRTRMSRSRLLGHRCRHGCQHALIDGYGGICIR
jgi:hypothetical protein